MPARRKPGLGVVLVDRARSALPMVAVAAVAGYTWWLVQSVPGRTSARGPEVPSSTPDYVMTRGTVERFDPQGRRVSVLRGQTMTHYLEGDRLLVQGLDLVARDERGQELVAVAREGHYAGAESVVRLRGQVKVTATAPAGAAGPARSGPLVFESESATLDTESGRVSSEDDVRLVGPDGVLAGTGFVHDIDTGMTEIGGRVRGRLEATPLPPSRP